MKEEKEIMLFEKEELGFKVRAIQNKNDEVLFNVEDVARAIKGKYVENKNGKEYVRLRNIKADLGKFDFRIESAKDFIPENMVYLLMMNGDGENSKKFQYWIATEVLPSIRQHGAYISDNSQEVDQDYVKFARGTVAETFKNCPMENIRALYDECMAFYSKKENKLLMYTEKGQNRKDRKFRKDKKLTNAESKLEITNIIVKALDERAKSITGSDFAEGLQKTIRHIDNNGKEIRKMITGGKMGVKTRRIKELEGQLNKTME